MSNSNHILSIQKEHVYNKLIQCHITRSEDIFRMQKFMYETDDNKRKGYGNIMINQAYRTRNLEAPRSGTERWKALSSDGKGN